MCPFYNSFNKYYAQIVQQTDRQIDTEMDHGRKSWE